MAFRYTDTALREIGDSLNYIAGDSPTAANDVSQAIEDTIALLRRQPLMACVVYRRMVRAFPVGDYPYRVFYQAKSAEIVIRNVRYMRRRQPWEGE
jgi:plasmid stabilization system protein ParE